MYGKDFGIPNIRQYLTVCSIKKKPSRIWNCRFFAIYLQHRKTPTNTLIHTFIHTIECFSNMTRYLSTRGDSMTMTEDERRKIGTFRGIDMDINREKLQQMADEEGIELNFERWDELLRDVRVEEPTDSNDSNEKQNDSMTKPKFVYNFDGQLIKTFNTTKECAEFFGIKREAVATYARSERPYFKFGVVITNELKDDKHKPYVKKRRLWFNDKFNDMFNDKSHTVQSNPKDD